MAVCIGYPITPGRVCEANVQSYPWKTGLTAISDRQPRPKPKEINKENVLEAKGLELNS